MWHLLIVSQFETRSNCENTRRDFSLFQNACFSFAPYLPSLLAGISGKGSESVSFQLHGKEYPSLPSVSSCSWECTNWIYFKSLRFNAVLDTIVLSIWLSPGWSDRSSGRYCGGVCRECAVWKWKYSRGMLISGTLWHVAHKHYSGDLVCQVGDFTFYFKYQHGKNKASWERWISPTQPEELIN